MKILYGINTNGQGHINRSRVFIDQLIQDGHEVHVLLSGKEPPNYAFGLAPKTFHKPGIIDLYKNNKVDLNKTIQANLINIGDYLKARRELLELHAKENYDAIFSDFEPSSSTLGRKIGKPVICIDRHHAVFHPAVETSPGKGYDKIAMRIAINAMIPYYNHCYALDFTQSVETCDDITLFPLVWKSEFNNYDVSLEDHFVVYLSWFEQDELIGVFSKFPNETFHVYGFNKEKKIDNIHFKATSRDGFLKDLVSCKAVIGNAGFNLAWETCLLGKLIWTIPLESQFEQVTNAHRLQILGQGYSSNNLSVEDFSDFLDWAEEKQYINKNTLTIKQPSDLLSLAYDFLEKYERENFPKPRQIKKGIKYDLNPWRMKQDIRKEVKSDEIN
ncbi:MAG TPA: glycosyltransferase family protein [Candidatus Bathyarchaeia archaeon]|nr:glycosyltransferase family protein [Candidatus Bathyarchaeia archaeon]